MTIAEFDHLSADKKKELLHNCCGSKTWVNKMLTVFPVNDLIDLFEYADEIWDECKQEDWLEAFEHHPQIGESNPAKEILYATADWAQVEQSGASDASRELSDALAEGNKKYREKFGYIFIVFATGKSAEEMLFILEKRLRNNPEDEIQIAAEEQITITKNRLEKLFL